MITKVYTFFCSSGMEKALAVLCSAHSLASNDRSLKAKVRSVQNAQRTFLLMFFHLCPLTPPPPPPHTHTHTIYPLQCTYSIGHCLHLLSKCASPDPELQWREGECEGWRLGGEGRRLGGEGAPHSTLSTIMRREEASQAEVSVAHPHHESLMCMCDNQKNMYHDCYCGKLQTDSVTY